MGSVRTGCAASSAADFYKLTLARTGSGVLGFALDLDARPIAGGICLVSNSTLEFFVSALDPAYSKFSPGNLLIEDIVRWCLPRGLDFDFRLTADPYKLRWMDRAIPFAYYDVGQKLRGACVAVRRKQAVSAWMSLKQAAKPAAATVGSARGQ